MEQVVRSENFESYCQFLIKSCCGNSRHCRRRFSCFHSVKIDSPPSETTNDTISSDPPCLKAQMQSNVCQLQLLVIEAKPTVGLLHNYTSFAGDCVPYIAASWMHQINSQVGTMHEKFEWISVVLVLQNIHLHELSCFQA